MVVAKDPDNQLHCCKAHHITAQTIIHQLFQVVRPEAQVTPNVSDHHTDELDRSLEVEHFQRAQPVACFV